VYRYVDVFVHSKKKYYIFVCNGNPTLTIHFFSGYMCLHDSAGVCIIHTYKIWNK